MAQLGLIWAESTDRVIGDGQQMPWHLPEDLAHFKATTGHAPVIMGSKTWASLPERFRPLPGRLNIVLSSRSATDLGIAAADLAAGEVVLCDSIPAALAIGEEHAQASGQDTYWVMGGGQVYAATIAQADLLVVTHVSTSIGSGVKAPAIPADFVRQHCGEVVSSRGGLDFQVCTYVRSCTTPS